MNWREITERELTETYEKIMEKLEGSTWMGIQFDPTNIKHLVVFTYGLASTDAKLFAKKQYEDQLDTIFGKNK